MKSSLIDRPPKSPGMERGGGGGRWKVLTVAKDQLTAHLIEGLLASEGIEAVLDRTNLAPGAFLKPFGDALAPVKVLVREPDFDAATLALAEVDHRPPDADAKGSPFVSRMWWLTIATVIVAAMLTFLEVLDFGPCAVGALCF